MGCNLKSVRRGKSRTRILLVDDHPIVRERLADIIHRQPDLRVCAEAEDRNQALQAAEREQPNLAIVDLTLKDSDGLELIKDLHSRWPEILVLVVSMHDESLYAERAIRAGARGYITKQQASRDILVAIRRVLQGNIYLNDSIATNIISRRTARPGAEGATPDEVLGDRELQVFELTGQGVNIRDIARRLGIGVKTVETYRARIRVKLNLKDSSELLRFAISWAHRR